MTGGPVTDAMIEAGVGFVCGMDHTIGKTSDTRAVNFDILRQDLRDIYLAMHSPVAVCEICDTPELCRSGKCPCGLCGEFVAPASTDIANDLLAKVRTSPAPTGGVVTDAMIEAGDAALKKLDFATWERMAPGEGQDFIRAILEAALTASGNSGAVSDDLRAKIAELEAERDTPEVIAFAKAVQLEAWHQRERWGAEHDVGKSPFDWFWLIGYLAQKAATAQMYGDHDKALHHTISTAAALANWHLAICGTDNRMRPGIDPAERNVA